jgi:hypothetical protein
MVSIMGRVVDASAARMASEPTCLLRPLEPPSALLKSDPRHAHIDVDGPVAGAVAGNCAII